MFFIAIVLCILRWLLRLKTEGQAIYRKIPRKVTKVNRNFRLSWASFTDRALKNTAHELRF